MRISFLQANCTEVLGTSGAKVGKFESMLLAGGQRVYFVKFLEVVAIHDSSTVVVLRALFAEVELLVETVDFSPLVFAVHALVLALKKLLLGANNKVNLILNLVLLLVVYHIVVLEGLLFAVTLQQDGVCQADLILDSCYLAQVDPAEQKGEYLVGPNLRVNVDMSAIENHFLRWDGVSGYFIEVLAVEVSDLEDPLCLEVLPWRLITYFCFPA